MKLFSQWELEESRRRQAVEAPAHKKVASVAHADIDRWLKSVDGLAKDLKVLQDAKDKAKGKMTQIGQKFKPDEKKPVEKEKEKEQDDDKPGIERKPVKRPRPQADRKVLSLRSKPEPESRREQPDEREERRNNRDDAGEQPAKRRIVKQRIKSKPAEDFDDDEDQD